MTTPRILIIVTVLNCMLGLTYLLQLIAPARMQSTAPVLRTRALQIVDEQGRVRASLEVLPASTSDPKRQSHETVLLRLITERGRPSVKIGASEETSGISLAGPTGTKDTYAILEATANTSSLKLRAENGREQIFRP